MKRFFLLPLLLIPAFFVLSQGSARALSGSEFRAGRIIDDGVFFNGQGMQSQDIQGFLNSKLPVCDTNGSKPYAGTTRAAYSAARGYNTPFVCLKDFRQETPTKSTENGLCNQYNGGNKSAAEIIYDVSIACGVNPKVLLVLLQKEQSLITDDWPWSLQYTKATGFGCPDSSLPTNVDANQNGCYDDNEGFFNQVYSAARQFKKYSRDQTQYRYRAGRDNYIQYHPNAGCGGSNVYIQNQATAGLYNYTPYQPNPSALANLYGSGDNCGAYGNRNFWRMYNDWFGSTYYSYGPVPSHQSLYARSACVIPYFDGSWVGRLYQPDVRNFLYTRDYNEACRAVSYGYLWDGIVMKNAHENDAIPVYRLSNYERNVFTTDTVVRDNAIALYGYKSEGIGFYVYGSNGASRTPVYGLQSGDTFFVTSAGKEAEDYRATYNYHLYGEVFYTPLIDNSTATVYRFTRNNQRLYTPHQSEIGNALRYGYQAEGSIGSNDLQPNPGSMPVYRIRTPAGVYMYTTSRAERDNAVLFHNCSAEGIPFYSLMWSNKPVFRAGHPYSGFWIYTPSSQELSNAVTNYQYIPSGVGWYSY